MMWNCRVGLILLPFLIISCVHSYSNLNQVHLNSYGGYEDVLVTVSPNLPAENCLQIIDNIKALMLRVSRSLFDFSSKYLAKALFFESVVIQVPESWTAINCQNTLTALNRPNRLSRGHSQTGDFIVSVDHPIGKDSVWTQQSQGCGNPGDFIYLPYSFVSNMILKNQSISNNIIEEKDDTQARDISDEWIRYRFGVFGSASNYGSKTNDGPSLNSDKHLAFCLGQSIIDVVGSHQDMINNSSKTTIFQTPRFELTRGRAPKYVIILENSKSMNIRDNWEFIRTATKKFILHDIPENADVGLVLFNNAAHIAHTVRKVSSSVSVRSDLAVLIVNKFHLSPNPESCVRCGFLKAIEALQTSGDTKGASLIIISQGTKSSLAHEQEGEELLTLARKHYLQIFSISIPKQHHNDMSHSLEKICFQTGGTSFFITEMEHSSYSRHSSLSIYVRLVDAFTEILARSSNDGPYLIYQKTFDPYTALTQDRIQEETGSFVVDKYIGRSTEFSVFALYPSGDKSGYVKSIDIQNRRGLRFKGLNEALVNFHILSVYKVDFEKDINVGMNWTYTLERLPVVRRRHPPHVYGSQDEPRNRHYVRVTSRGRHKNSGIKIRFFTNQRNHLFNKVTSQYGQKAVILYVEVKLNQVSVVNANVVVELQPTRQTSNSETAPPQSLRIQLLDNGNGDPDISANDGIYSRYLVDKFNREGRFSVTIFVDDNFRRAFSFQQSVLTNGAVSFDERKNCCKSTTKTTNQKLGTFKRIVQGDSFRIINANSQYSVDLQPPSRVLDLTVDVLTNSQQLEFEWTAPGDNFDTGKATSYFLYASNNSMSLYNQHNERIEKSIEVVDSFNASQEAGKKERHRINVMHFNVNVFYAIVAVDGVGNVGGISNVLGAYMPTPSSSTSLSSRSFSNSADNSYIDVSSAAAHDGQNDIIILYIFGGIIGFIIVCIFLIALIFFNYRRKNGKNNLEEQDDVVYDADEEEEDMSIDPHTTYSLGKTSLRSTGVTTQNTQRNVNVVSSAGFSVMNSSAPSKSYGLEIAREIEARRFLNRSNFTSASDILDPVYASQAVISPVVAGDVGSTYGWTKLNNPYVTAPTLPTYRDFQNCQNAHIASVSSVPHVSKNNPTCSLYTQAIPKHLRGFSHYYSGDPIDNSPSTLSTSTERISSTSPCLIPHSVTKTGTITPTKKSILKKPKLDTDNDGLSSWPDSAKDEAGPSSESTTSTASFINTDRDTPTVETLTPPSPVLENVSKVDDKNANSSVTTPFNLSPNNTYLETSFEYPVNLTPSKVPPPTFPKPPFNKQNLTSAQKEDDVQAECSISQSAKIYSVPILLSSASTSSVNSSGSLIESSKKVRNITQV